MDGHGIRAPTSPARASPWGVAASRSLPLTIKGCGSRMAKCGFCSTLKSKDILRSRSRDGPRSGRFRENPGRGPRFFHDRRVRRACGRVTSSPRPGMALRRPELPVRLGSKGTGTVPARNSGGRTLRFGVAPGLPVLDVGEAFVVGDASLLPTRILITEPSMQPDSQTVAFWDRWNDTNPESDTDTDTDNATRSWRRQSMN